jgi:hypothetical protein
MDGWAEIVAFGGCDSVDEMAGGERHGHIDK